MRTVVWILLGILTTAQSVGTKGLSILPNPSETLSLADVPAELTRAVRQAVPPGGVMAFNLPECQDGWLAFEPLIGRVAVGVGGASSGNVRGLGERGGEEQHVLSIIELPSHTHSYVSSSGMNSPRGIDFAPGGFDVKDIFAETSATGGGAAHNNMQPFTVLTYCVRT